MEKLIYELKKPYKLKLSLNSILNQIGGKFFRIKKDGLNDKMD